MSQVPPPFGPADLDGLTIGQAFQKFVIKNADLQAVRFAVVAEDPIHQSVFDEGRWPGIYGAFVWPIDPTVDQLLHAFGRTHLIVVGRASSDQSPSDVVRGAAALIADRCEILFGFLRRGEAVATGTNVTTGSDGPLSKVVWSRKGSSVDIATNDFIDDVAGKNVVRWGGLVVSAVVTRVIVVPADYATGDISNGRRLSSGGAKKPGIRPKILKKVMARMLDDIEAGRRTPTSLDAMLEKDLVATYGHSRDTCRKARKFVLTQLEARSKRD